MVGNTQAIWMWAPKDDAMASDLAARDEQPGRSFFPFQAADERESVNPATSAVTCMGPFPGNEKTSNDSTSNPLRSHFVRVRQVHAVGLPRSPSPLSSAYEPIASHHR